MVKRRHKPISDSEIVKLADQPLLEKVGSKRRLQSFSDLSDEQRSTIQDAIANFRAIEAKVDRFKDDVSKLDVSRLNSIVSQQVDGLLAILAQLKARGGSRS